MTTLTQHAPGTFCWPELASTDTNAAKTYYTSLFGWTANEIPTGPETGSYTIFQKQGKDCGALHALMPDQLEQHVPPHWGVYVSVASADEAVAKTPELGGKVLMGPFDVMETLGRMAVIQDPTGAVFQVWQAKNHIGAAVLDEPGALCWTELMTSDVPGAERFYSRLVGWKTETMPMPNGTYTLFKRGETNAAGLMAMPPELRERGIPPHWLSYFQVENAQDTVNRSNRLGGKTQVPPTPIPNVGTFAVLQDPQGAVFGILQAEPR